MNGLVEAVLEDVAVAGSGEFFIVLLKTHEGRLCADYDWAPRGHVHLGRAE